jgi:hypothetical protein
VERRSECEKGGETWYVAFVRSTHSHQHFMRWGRFQFSFDRTVSLLHYSAASYLQRAWILFFLKSWHHTLQAAAGLVCLEDILKWEIGVDRSG